MNTPTRSLLPPPEGPRLMFWVVLSLAFAGGARAELVGNEPFGYPDGAIAGRAGGTVWNWINRPDVGTAGAVSNWDTVFGNPVVTGEKLITDDSGVKREFNGQFEAESAFNDPSSVPSSIRKVVFFRVDVTTGATVPTFIGLSSYDFGSERLFFGKRFGQSAFGLEISNGSGVNSAVSIDPNTTYTLVAKLDFANDQLALWIDPNFNQANPPPNETLGYTGTNWSTALRLASGGGGAVKWDNLVVSTTFADLNTADTGDYYFVAAPGAGRILNEHGFPLTAVAGAPLARIVETERAVEFHFDRSLEFSPEHGIFCVGAKPVRIVVDGAIVIPPGMVVSANSGPSAELPGVTGALGAGAGAAGAGGPGGHAGFIWPAHWMLEYQADSRSGLRVLPHHYESTYAPLIPANGAAEYASVRGAGGAGGSPGLAAQAGAEGGAGIEPGYIGTDGHEVTPVPKRRELDGISGLSGGFSEPGRSGKPGFGHLEVAAGGEEMSGGRAAPVPFFPAIPVVNQGSGWGGAGGAGAISAPLLVAFNGTPGSVGGRGANGFNAGFGRHGAGGKSPANVLTAPVLRGGGGGAGGSGGGGGEGGGAGGSGGGGGGGGVGYFLIDNALIPVLPGGAGGRGGYGEPGGEGGAGRPGAAGGLGAGAFDLSATGPIIVGGRLEAEGQPGQSANRTATAGIEPALPASFTHGEPGQPGSASGNSRSGDGGAGGQGGQGGKGGAGGGGGHGGGGAGGTITLHARTINFTTGNPDNHLFVGGGAGGSGGDPTPPAGGTQQANYPFAHDPPTGRKGDDGKFFVIANPRLQVSPAALNVAFARFGPQPAPTPTFTVTNSAIALGAAHLRPVANLPWVSFTPPTATNLAPGASVSFQLVFDTPNAGGGNYAGVITVASTDPHSTATPAQLGLNVAVSGPPDDFGSTQAGARRLDFDTAIDILGRLETVGDQDWFEIPLSASRRFIEVESRGSTNTTGDVRNSAAALVGTYEDAHVANPNFRFEYLATETETRAFVVVRSAAGATGDYTLRLRGAASGRVNAFVRVEWINGHDVLFANGREGRELRLVGTNDGTRWRYASTQTYSLGAQTQVIDLVGAAPFENYALIEGEAVAHTVARITSSSAAPGSATVTALTPDTVFTAGSPALAGKTALTRGGTPLNQDHFSTQGPVVITSFAGGKSSPWSFVQSPGNWAGGPVPAGFPNGAWLSSTEASGAARAGVPMGVVIFATPETWGTYLRPQGFSMNGLFAGIGGWSISASGSNPASLTALSQHHLALKPEMFSATANLMVCGSSATPTIVGTHPREIAGWTIVQQDLNGNPVHTTQGCAIATVPFAQPYAAVGRVNADGTKEAGADNFSVRWDAAITGYRITPTGFGNLNNGALLVNSHDPVNVAAMSWEVSPDATQLLVYARRTPLSQGGFQQCGFAFAYFPADALHFGPLLGVDFSDISVRIKGEIDLTGFRDAVTVNRGQPAPSRKVTLTNTGDGTLDVQLDFAGIPGYLAVSPQAAILPPGASTEIDVVFDTASLDLGSYNPRIRFLSPDPSVEPVTLSFTLAVVPGLFLVDTAVDENNGIGSGTGTSLREAAAAAFDGAVVEFAPALDGASLSLNNGPIVLNKEMRIDASQLSSGVAITANGLSRIFSVPISGNVLLDSLTLRSGHAGTGTGGAVTVEGGGLGMIRCTLTNNQAQHGGAAAVSGFGRLGLEECLVLNNTATGIGGGIFSDAADSVLILNSTFTENIASDGGAVWCQGAGAISTLAFATITRNQGIFAVVSFVDTTLRNTIIADNSNNNYFAPTPPHLEGTNLLTGSPLLAPLGDYGGPTRTMALMPGSLARDAATGSPRTTDQRGFFTVGAPDIGAYEAGTPANYEAWIWETLEATATRGEHAPTVDFDLDGATNGAEWLALTNPSSARGSFFPTSAVSSADLVISFPTVTGRIYTLERSDTLAPNSWTTSGLPAPLAGNGSVRSFTLPAAAQGRGFFRVLPGF